MEPANNRLIAAIERVLEQHGCSLRSQRQRTGLAHSTVKGWLDGIRPTMEGVIAFSSGFGEDVNEWLELAGYEPLKDRQAEGAINAADALIATWEALCEENPEWEIPFPTPQGGVRTLTMEQVETYRPMVEDRIRRGVYRRRE